MISTLSIVLLAVILGVSVVALMRHLRAGAGDSKFRYADRILAIAIIIGLILFTLAEQFLKSPTAISDSSFYLKSVYGAAFVLIGIGSMTNGLRLARFFMRPKVFGSYLASQGEGRLRRGLRVVGAFFVLIGLWLLWFGVRASG